MTAPVTPLAAVDPFDATRPHRASGLLGAFADARVLTAADVHVARTLLSLAGTDDEAEGELVALGVAFAVRAVRHRSVVVDLDTVASTATTEDEGEVDLSGLPWPDPAGWTASLARSPLVAIGDDDPAVAPLRLVGSGLLLDRYWRHERAVAADLATRATIRLEVDEAALRTGLDRLFDDEPPDLQRVAAAVAVLRALGVVAGGPGTGKTTTVARILALLHHQPTPDGQPLRVALAAPTGKAAARLQESVQSQAARLPVDDDVRRALLATEASTIHRLLGWRPDNRSRFRHDRQNPLPHHVVVVDETSMVSLSQMARLLEAVRPTARLVLVGDPRQLTAVEAGAVLADVVGPAGDGPRMTDTAAAELAAITGHDVGPDIDPRPGSVGDSIVVLRRVHRFGGAVGALAAAIEAGDADATVALLASDDDPGVRWFDADAAGTDATAVEATAAVRDVVTPPAATVIRAARDGRPADALRAMREAQILCAHRHGPHGVSRWRDEVERWLADTVDAYQPRGWFAGRPLLVTSNDYTLGLYNGDTGVAIQDGDGLRCAFERQGDIVRVSPHRLSAVETLYAMTIHKSQGSQFGAVVVVLPDETSPILTRELLYTAVTRAERAVTIVGTETAVRAAVDRPVSRASGLRERLWGAR